MSGPICRRGRRIPYDAPYTQVVQRAGGRRGATAPPIVVADLNAKFDEVYGKGGIYHFMSHPQSLDFGPEGFYEKHLAHIGRRPDVWYVPMGPVYAFKTIVDATEVKPVGDGGSRPRFSVSNSLDRKIYSGSIGYQPVPAERLRAYFDYLKAQEGRLWVATFQDGAKYARERMRSTVNTKPAGDAIEVTVTHKLSRNLYDLPLTARTTVPSDWTSVQIRQGSQTRTAPVQKDGGESYVQYAIAPNGGVARLQRARADRNIAEAL